jgi:two-component system NtrC family sensor kinase
MIFLYTFYIFKKKFMRIQTKITLGLIIIILLSYITVAIVVSVYVNKVFIREVQTRVSHDLFTAHNIYNGYVERVDQILRAISIRRTIDSPLEKEIEGDLGKVFKNIYEKSGIDILTLIDLDGNVIYRAHNPGSKGDNISDLSIVKKVLNEGEPCKGTIVFSREILEKEGKEILDKAAINIKHTPKARPVLKNVEDRGMFISAAVPFVSLYDNKKLGILLGGYILNRNNEIVDQIKTRVFEDQKYEGKEIGTATIFFDDLRISTNVKSKDNERAIGSRLSTEVYNHVILNGKVWADRAFVVNDWYITSYEPIRDIDNKIIGSLYVGLLEAPFKQPQRIIVFFIIIMLCITAISGAILVFFYTKLMMKPIDRIVLTSKKITNGDLSARCRIRPSGEMGILCKTIDQMADSIEEFEKNLQKETQLQIGQSEKLASIGRLAAGIAHEISNPLTSILNFAHLLKQKKSNNEEDLKDLDIIIHETNRVRKIVRELLDFARQSPTNKEWIDINSILQQLVQLIKRQKEFREIKIIENYTERMQPFLADRNQFQQIFLNLLLNAAEAITQTGIITITTATTEEHVKITITDTGCGIRKDNISKIFDPFYTTKPAGKGTGLGLSISYGIIQQYDGSIECKSKEGQGTEFSVVFPCQDAEQNSIKKN